MLDRKGLEALGCWTGYRLERVEWPEGEGRTLSLYLKSVSKNHVLRAMWGTLPADPRDNGTPGA